MNTNTISQSKVSEALVPVIAEQWLEHSTSVQKSTLERYFKEHLFPTELVEIWEESAVNWQRSR